MRRPAAATWRGKGSVVNPVTASPRCTGIAMTR
jgi:hypothetical protein